MQRRSIINRSLGCGDWAECRCCNAFAITFVCVTIGGGTIQPRKRVPPQILGSGTLSNPNLYANPNPAAKQHEVVSIELYKCLCIQRNSRETISLTAPFLLRLIVTVTSSQSNTAACGW